jgi:hypothetical protein
MEAIPKGHDPALHAGEISPMMPIRFPLARPAWPNSLSTRLSQRLVVSPDLKDLTLETSPEVPPQSAPIHDRASLAYDFLSFAHTEAQTHVSNLHMSTDSNDSLADYLDSTLKLLDLCNSISSLIERLRLCRLLLNFILHLLAPFDLGFPALEKVRRARDLLSDWGKPSFDLDKWGFQSNPEDLCYAHGCYDLGS